MALAHFSKRLHLLSQSSGVKGSMLMVCATGGSRCTSRPTCKESVYPTRQCGRCVGRGGGEDVFAFCPSVSPRSRPNVVSSSTVEISCSLEKPPFIPSRPTTGASFRLLGMPVQPKKHDRCGGAPLTLPEGALYCSSIMTFCAGYSIQEN